MYKIMLKWWTRGKDWRPVLPCYTKCVQGDTLKECMNKVNDLKYTHDLFTFTKIDIVDVTEE